MHQLLQDLCCAIEDGNPKATEEFWSKVGQIGTPLVEEIPNDPNRCMVTFLWQDQGHNTTGVLIIDRGIIYFLQEQNDLSPLLMNRISGTDVWYLSLKKQKDLRTIYQFFPLEESSSSPSPTSLDTETIIQYFDNGKKDPFNKNSFSCWGWLWSVIELPFAPEINWWGQSNNPQGELLEKEIFSSVLKSSGKVWTYLPVGYSGEICYPVTTILDGHMWNQQLDIRWALDNLIAAGKIPPMVVIMPSIFTQDRIKEFTSRQDFTHFIGEEILPWAHSQWNITSEADKSIICGQSLGGYAAMVCGITLPHIFGNVVSQSGSFWFREDEEFDLQEEELINEISLSPQVPINIHLRVGSYFDGCLSNNRHMRNVLQAKGYRFSYTEWHDGHNEYAWRSGLADGLIEITKNW